MPPSGAGSGQGGGSGGGLGLDLAGLRVEYPTNAGPPRRVLEVPALRLPAGAATGVRGASGAGKTSLLHVLAGIERPAAGRVRWGEAEVSAWPEGARDAWRRRHVGLVFQDFHLADGLDARGNVLLPLWFERLHPPREMRERADALLAAVGLPDPAARVEAMSRGERQRVAVARALLRRPGVLLADEPTASLDAEAAAGVGALLLDAAREGGATLVVATHDPALLDRLPRRWTLAGGRLEEA